MHAVGSQPARPRWLAPGLLLLILAVALALRLAGLDGRTLDHAEVYVPRLEMPAYVSAPPPRETLRAAVLGTLNHDNHPPGYYAAMWAWTGLAGTGLFALRLPSALAGAASVLLLYWLARRRGGEGVALTAAALLALHGHHLFWSQQARMWIFLTLLALLSVLLLDSLGRRWRAAVAAAYVLTTSLALWLEYSFWPFFAVQVAWEIWRRGDEPRWPASLDLQVLSLVLASPLLAFLKFHLAHAERTQYLARSALLDHVTGFLLLQWLVRAPVPPEKFGALASLAVLALLAAGSVFLIAGVAASRSASEAPVPGPALGAPPLLLAALPPTLFCLAVFAAGGGGRDFAVAAALPWLLLGARAGAVRAWPRWSSRLRRLRGQPRLRRLLDDPVALHTLAPLTVLLLASLIVPSVAPRSLLFLTPFAVLLVVRGLAALLPHAGLRAAATAALLLAATVSAVEYSRDRGDHTDFQALARAMEPLLLRPDTILVNDAWYAQPMHYYLPPSRHRTGDFGAHVPELSERVWIVIFHADDVTAFQRMAPRLRGYRETRRVSAPGGYALLLERAPPG